MKRALILVLVALVALLVSVARREYLGLRNDLTAQREAVTNQWSNVNEALRQRAALVPGMVDAVQRFAPGETAVLRETAGAVAQLAGAAAPPARILANRRLDTAIARLLLVAENYPKLRSDAAFLRLQDDLADSENRIAVERRKYNEALQRYNTSISLFPGNIVAGISGMARDDAYFQTEPGAHAAPQARI